MDQETEKKAAETAEPAADAGKPENDEKNKKPDAAENSKNAPKKKKKKKYKLQVMDVVTIVFTVVIVGIMAYVLYNQFAGESENPSAPTASGSATAAPTATPQPVLSDIGNIYGNIINDANVVVIDEREYFISADDNGETHIFAALGDDTKDLIQTDASSLNVVTDYITYADQSNVTAYYVFYINGDGKICYVHDGPVGGDGLEEKTNLEEQVFLDGSYQSICVSGEYVYYLDEAGKIGKAEIATGEVTELGTERVYKSFVLYYGVIYALGAEDSFIYSMPSNPADDTESSTASPAATAEAEEESRETLLIDEACRSFVIDSDWIYVLNDSGIVRYLMDGSGKDTLSGLYADAINVYEGALFYLSEGSLYTASAEKLLLNEPTQISEAYGSSTINLSESSVYLKNESGKLLKSSYDSENSKYEEFTAMS